MHSGLPRAISRDELATLPVRRYDGAVCLVTTPVELARAQAEIRAESVLGFDTETRPAFRKGESYPPCLVQVATARTVFLFPLRSPHVFPVIAELLAEPRATKVGVAMANDMRPLKQLFAFNERNLLDLGVVARRCGFGQTGLRNLAGIFLGFRIPKGSKTSNWGAAQLTSAQISYAATDAWASRELFLRFQSLDMLQVEDRPPSAPGQIPGAGQELPAGGNRQ